MATTEKFFNGDGSDVTFDIPFEYLEESDVKVSVGGTLKTQDTDYTFSSITEITFNTAPPAGTNNVRIFRDTDINSLRNEFFAGSAIRAQDLNDDFNQNIFALQEFEDQFVTKTDGEFDTNVDMNNNRVTEMADPVNAKDAVNKQYFEANSWDSDTETIKTNESWPASSNDQIATTGSIENRVTAKIDSAIEDDILIDNTGLTKNASGGQTTLGIGANAVDLDRIKNSDIINNAEQDAQNPSPSDNNIFTALAAKTRHDTLIQTGTPAGSTFQTGKMWYQNDNDQTVHLWNGSAWEAVTSGGTFTKLDKVIYVDSINGDDNNEGHRISNPKKTIKAAVDTINNDSTFGDGSVVLVAPGIYQEAAPIDIHKRDVSIIGASVRNCVVHPTAATETSSLFRVNSGTYLHNLTFTGMKASGTRGASGSLWEDATFGLPPTQGWNVSFFPGAMIFKSPYVQNCTNFSDSEIDNNNLAFYAGDENKGRAGDLDHAPTGGGLLVDGSVPHADSPLRSIVADSYTHTALDGPGVFVTNNGYTQITSSYAFFNHFHIACLNGGQANLAASTTDFGRFSLVADGKSTSTIFTARAKGAQSDGSTTITIDNVVASSGWHGSATTPASNMLLEVNSVIYPILSATTTSDGFTVTISRPNLSDRTQNDGLNGAVSDNATVNFYLRSMIASAGHTMEYVGAGMDYRALPEYAAGTYAVGSGTSPNGVHQESHQKTERNNGKVWAAITDHNGKFKVGDTFSVDQQSGFVDIPAGALSVSKLLADLDVNGKRIITDSGNENVVISPHGTGTVDVDSSRITSVTNPTNAQDAATKNYVDSFESQTANIGDLQVTGDKIANNTIDSTKLTAATVVTNSEQSGATVNDTSFFTTSASDARYFNISSGDTIKDGQNFPDNDTSIATTAAINDRIIDLIDDVGGFVPLASEADFPNANPDVNNGAGTIVSIGVLGASYSPSSGTVTIPDSTLTNISGSNVTITDCGTTVLAAGFGCLVETTSTLHQYKFHRLTPKATEVTTVAGISGNVTTVAGISANVTTVAGISSDVTTVANNNANVTAVAGKATEIGRLGTADAVADMAILGTNDVVADLNTLATSDIVSDMNTLATSANVTAMSNCSDDISNINTVAGSISNVNTVSGSISNVNTCASNLTNINNFANRYRISANAPTTSLDDGDLWWDTTNDTLKVYDDTSSSWVAGVTTTSGFATTSGFTMSGDIAMGSNSITGLDAPSADNDAARKKYVDDTIDSKIDTALTSDVVGGTGITVSDNTPGSGQITVAVTAGSIGATQLANTSVSAGSYTLSSITVDSDGRITSASSGSVDADKIEEGTTNVECVDTGTDGHILFDTEGQERMRIDSTGRITIARAGHVRPTSGASNVGLLTVIGDESSQSNAAMLNLWHNGAPGTDEDLGVINFLGEEDTGVPAAQIKGRSDGTWNNDDSTDHPGELQFLTTANDSAVPSVRMIIESNGDVGIGTTSPLATLHVDCGSTNDTPAMFSTSNANGPHIRFRHSSENLHFIGAAPGFVGSSDRDDLALRSKDNMIFATGNTTTGEAMRIGGGGKVGIGTTAPSTKLHTKGTTNGAQATFGAASSGLEISTFQKTNDDAGVILDAQHSSHGTLTFATKGTERIRIDSDGKVGIGESGTLDALLVIKGASDQNTTPSIRLKDGTDTRECWITNTSGDLVLCNGGNDNTPHCYLKMFDGNRMDFATENTTRATINDDGHLVPGADSTYNFGSSSNRWSNVYADNLHGDGSNITNLPAASGQGVAKRWVAFNQGSIIDSYNVSSVSDNGTGSFSVNFSSNMANANYAVTTGSSSTQGYVIVVAIDDGYGRSGYKTNGGFSVFTHHNGNSSIDEPFVSCVVHGD